MAEKKTIYADDLRQAIVEDKQIRGQAFAAVMRHIEAAPAVDAVEVVRCKDCKWAKSYDRGDGLTGYYCQHPNSTFLYGTNWERIFEPVRESNDFCSHGNKKEA